MSIKLDGFYKLENDLVAMARMVDGTAVDAALNAGAKPILEEMQHQAQIDPKVRSRDLLKSLRKSRVTYGRTRSSKKTRRIQIGAFEGRKAGMAPHAHLVEYGHGGPASAPPHPFIRPSFDKKKDEAVEIMKDILRKNIRW